MNAEPHAYAGEAQPEISVVVPTRNRAHLMLRLLASLAAQRGSPPFEVIVVDDCSTDETAAVLAGAGGQRFPLRVLRTPRPAGAGAARNVGWRAARGRFIAFTDDDCVPRPGWLAALVASLTRDGADVVQGRVEYDLDANAHRGAFGAFVWIDQLSWQFETCNVVYRRDLLELLGGFDDAFESDAFGEDIDLGWRALGAGARCVFAPEALVIHDVKAAGRWPDFTAALRNTRRWRHIGRVVRDHPGYAARRLHHGIFLRPTHPPTILALAGLAVAATEPLRPGRLALAAAAAGPWVVLRSTVEVRQSRPRNRPLVLPFAFMVDVAEVAVTVASAIRYRAWVV